ncbi:hypothetical protein [Streptomyces sp. NBC_01012]|uniref:hypothetical protein n=1 Tax=Streptomyces sp. NBC_01012 TaxID=2903717 RepID=UPI003869553F|nr:hypothetical protein OG623_11570 [Streptomyces sp. NBC_01012]
MTGSCRQTSPRPAVRSHSVRGGLGYSAVVVLLTAAAVGCGIRPTGPVDAGAPASGVPRAGTEARSARLYFSGPYGIQSVPRLTGRPLSPQHALDLLLKGPDAAERKRGLVSQVPPMGGQLTANATTDAVDVLVPVSVSSGDLDVTAISQIACTAAHAEVPGAEGPAQIDIRIHENLVRSDSPWTVRCGPDNIAVPVTD